jgi:hypothetical protein
VRCVDETTYCIDGIKYWLWVATSDKVCVLLLAPTRSSAELKQLLGEDFEGILSSDCFSAYNPQSAAAKQKCSGGDKGVRRLAGYGLERLTPVDKMSAYCEQK